MLYSLRSAWTSRQTWYILRRATMHSAYISCFSGSDRCFSASFSRSEGLQTRRDWDQHGSAGHS
jgi:hypothetical protein